MVLSIYGDFKMANGIALISWDDKIGAILIAQHPQTPRLSVKDVMSIYNVHRQNTLEPNFGTLVMKELKVASFFTGLKTTRYVGPAPNYILSLLLDKNENPAEFKKFLPNLTTEIIIPHFLKILPEYLEKISLEARNIVGIILIQRQTEDERPLIVLQDFKKALDLTTGMIEGIWDGAMRTKADERYFEYKSDNLRFGNFFTGNPSTFVVMPNLIVSFIFEDVTSISEFKKTVLDYSFDILMKIVAILTEGLNKVSELELQTLEMNFMSSAVEETVPVLDEKDEEKRLQDKLAKIQLKTQVKDLEYRLIESEEEKQKRQTMLEGDKEAIEHMVEMITKFQNELMEKTEETFLLEKKIEEKDQHLRNLLKIIRSLRKYVSY